MSTTWFKKSCHGGAVRFEVRTAGAPAVRCNGGPYRRRDAPMNPTFTAAGLTIAEGEGALTCYRFSTRTVRHPFSGRCGSHPFHRIRKNGACRRVNLGCVGGLDPQALDATVADGASLSIVEGA
ncbi:aldehyde-activating protein [Burkholderia sp. MSh2]|uniref:Aldehyde-activating protein n=1 Tax=Burkholderia paludis TaxID=1506587 RepID=A0A6J5CW09_9BURK|nr:MULTISPECIES: aldehyde-activating protein [Burkholderia]KEZ05808.1 aldehyde-activating protein [Burkholderia sp. MSh2]CAB3746330.1 hypothetical protein LMG30113_00167 [Burkholderia paludis]VWB24327.1 aldehyde-activating protein [Burkholderia paludis]